jgi:hypothetical protein
MYRHLSTSWQLSTSLHSPHKHTHPASPAQPCIPPRPAQQQNHNQHHQQHSSVPPGLSPNTTPLPATPLQIWEENRLLVQPSSSSLQEHCLALPAKPEGRPTPFGLQVDSGTVLVDDLVLYCHVEQQGVYGVDGGELALAGAVRHMNAALPEESFVKLWAD